MEPKIVPPLVAPSAATTSFRDRLRKGAVKKAQDNKVTIQLPMEVSQDGNYFMVRIPRHMDFADVRTKDAYTDDAGKLHKEAAMLTIVTTAVKDVDYTMSFTDGYTRLDMPARPGVTLNLSLDFGAVKLFNAENGEEIAAQA